MTGCISTNSHTGNDHRSLSKLIKTRKGMEKEMCEEPDIEAAMTGDSNSSSRKSQEWWVQTKAKALTVDQQILNVMRHLDNLRGQLDLGKEKDQAAVNLSIHWLMVELDTGNRHTFPATSSRKTKLISKGSSRNGFDVDRSSLSLIHQKSYNRICLVWS